MRKTHHGAVDWSQIALAAVVSVMPTRYVVFISVKLSVRGTSPGRQRGRRTAGKRTMAANVARQKANRGPRSAAGQSSNSGALANRPLELHRIAAART